ncbi:nitroreductase family deazaflavin-dependent oxidoreductase [Streptomyces sp. NPDC048527]|uniref:nitroreductase family deazaflavin-dependent oxidoreductase n=1 Tax=Streptomyces sp. NPDC048527 TaxID=3365568 RepID=UPI0037200236
MLFQEEHIRAYEETDGTTGHEWLDGVYTLVLTTTGRKSGEERKFAVIYRKVGDDYVVVASRGGMDTHPNWYLNLLAHPEIRIQVGPDKRTVRARTTEGEEREQLWPLMVEAFPTYAEYQQQTDRTLPVVVLQPI